MISSFLLGIAGGFVLSIPPGPLSIAVTRQALSGTFRAGFLMAVAAAAMDVVYMLIATFASSAIVLTLRRIIAGSPWFPLIFQAACVVVLLYLGISFLTPKKSEKKASAIQERERQQEERAKSMGRTSPFFIGLLIAVTNLASPTFLPSMITFVGFLHANAWIENSFLMNVAFSFGFGMGTTIWFFLVMRTLLHFRTRLPATLLTGIYRFAGGTMLLFAVVIAYHAVTATVWKALF